jgi:hypothetical protein
VKFLCIPCDSPMKLIETKPPDRGSLALVYQCPECGYEMAMLTNPFETQVVGSLGVNVGPEGAGEQAPAASKCPVSAMARSAADVTLPFTAGPSVTWTAEAEARLGNVPPFARPMARTGIEKFARERGYPEIDARVMDEAKDFFGM